MKKNLKQSILLLLCVALLVPAIGSFTVFAAEDEETFEDIWKDTLYPAYMKTEYKTVKDRLKGDSTIAPMTLYCVVGGVAFYVDSITGEMIALTLADPQLTKEDIEQSEDLPEYTAYYSTNPFNAGSSESAGGKASSEAVKETLYSQLIVEYTSGNSDMKMNSFKDAAANNQIKVNNIRNGIRVEYSIGREQVTYLVPRMIRADKFEALVEQVRKNSSSERDARTLMAFYNNYDLNNPDLPELTKLDYERDFPITKKFPIYVCEEHTTAKERLRLETIIKLYTDYTLEQMEIDHAETEYVSSEENPPLFKLAIEYRVDGKGGITIRLNAGNIRFASDLYSLSNVVLLPYGGAGDTRNDGYIFTPDGSGSLIDFKDAAMAGNVTKTSSMYGIDYVYHTVTGANQETMRLPVYGVVEYANNGTREEQVPVMDDSGNPVYRTDANGDYVLDKDGNPIPLTETTIVTDFLKIGYMAVVEKGDSLARVKIENGGSQHSFVSVCTTFNPRPQDTYSLSGGISNNANATWTVSSKRKYTGDYQIRLFMLSEDVTYSEMARIYQQYLVDQGTLTKLETDTEDIPLYLETLGALEVRDSFLGIPITKMVALSSFADDKQILDDMSGAGISNVNIKLNGWNNGGMFFTPPTKLKIEKVLGGESGFKDLVSYANEKGATIFPDLDFVFANAISFGDNFSVKKHCSKTIDDRTAGVQTYDPAWQGFVGDGRGLISPNWMMQFYDQISKKYLGYNVGAISVCSLGSDLSSDFNEDDPLTREDSKILVEKLMKKISEQNKRVLVSGGNAYVLPYVTDIIDVPLESSGYNQSCASVPFMGMVLHGYKEFSGAALNLAGDYTFSLLKTIESGASPYFIIAFGNTAELKDYTYSTLSDYYSVRYAIWKDSIVSTYHLLNDALKSVRTETIVSHELLDYDNKVVKVTYSNGEIFYLNYLLKDYSVTIGEKRYEIPTYGFLKVCKDGKVLAYDGSELTEQ